MQDRDDFELLTAYVREGSESAFAALSARHVHLVHSAAWRQVNDAHVAEEITQAVFILLAQKAHTFRKGIILSAWLLRATRFTATNVLVSQYRRTRREQEAVQMQTIADDEHHWEEIAPLLDEALAGLGEQERNALALRFFERKRLEEVGTALGIDADTARKRVARAVEKLRKFLSRRGVVLSAAGVTAALSANAVQAAPAALVASLATAATIKGAAVSVSTTTLIKGTIKLMAWAKMKTMVVVGACALLAAGTATVAVQELEKGKTPAAEPAAQPWQSQEMEAALNNAPPQVMIVPTRFRQSRYRRGEAPEPEDLSKELITAGSTGYGSGNDTNAISIGLCATPLEILEYVNSGVQPGRMVLPAGLPKERYDYIAKLPGGAREALLLEIKKQFGLTGRFETRETDVLLLKLNHSGAPGLKPSTDTNHSRPQNDVPDKIHCTWAKMGSLTYDLENSLRLPVLDRTGLTGEFEMLYSHYFSWDATQDQMLAKARTVMMDEMGLDLVPAREPLEVFVVEKVK